MEVAGLVMAVVQLTALCLEHTGRWAGAAEIKDLRLIEDSLHEFKKAIQAFEGHVVDSKGDEVRLTSPEYLRPVLDRTREALHVLRSFTERTGRIGQHLIRPGFDRKLRSSLEALGRAKEVFILAVQADEQAISLAVERYMHDIADELRGLRGDVAGLTRKRDTGDDRILREVKRLRTEQVDCLDISVQASSSIKKTLDLQVSRTMEQGKREILNWVSPMDYGPRQREIMRKRQEGTGGWMLQSEEYLNFTKQGGKCKTLFCPGIPGSGKTFAAAMVVDDLEKRYGDDETVGIAYIYCMFKMGCERPTFEHLLGSLLKQLCTDKTSAFVRGHMGDMYKKHFARRTRPRVEDLLQVLSTVASSFEDVFLVVDALDECDSKDGCRSNFMTELFGFRDKCGANLFATSRSIPDITDRFCGTTTMKVWGRPSDIQMYLEGQMSRLPGFIQDNVDLREEIKKKIVSVAAGMFLLARLYFESLVGKISISAVHKFLRKLSAGSAAYDDTYSQAMARIEGQNPDQATLGKQVLAWIAFAERPLTKDELGCGLAIEVGSVRLDPENFTSMQDILSACVGLVVVDEGLGAVRLVHHTAQEFLVRKRSMWFPAAEEYIGAQCLACLLFPEFATRSSNGKATRIQQNLNSPTLYEYAAQHWGDHARRAQVEIPGVMSLLQSKPHLQASCQSLPHLSRDDKRRSRYSFWEGIGVAPTGVHVAAYFGLTQILEKLLLLNPTQILGPKAGEDASPLALASMNGHEQTVKLLLDQGAPIDALDAEDRTALSWAAERGHAVVAKVRLKYKADAEIPNERGLTPLGLASANNHEHIVNHLLNQGANINAQASEVGTPLNLAVELNHAPIVTLLLSAGARTDIQGFEGRTPLCMAAARGHETIIELLLDHGADIDLADRINRSPLESAIREGRERVARMLFERGARRPLDGRGFRALAWAVYSGKEEMVRLLLEKGANPKALAWHGTTHTVLNAAVCHGYEGIAMLLRNRISELEREDEAGLKEQKEEIRDSSGKFSTEPSL